MIDKFIFIVFLFKCAMSDKNLYLPMDDESKYGDDICRYEENDHYYVRACGKGKYCKDPELETSVMAVCIDLPKPFTLSNLEDGKCTTTFECEEGLECLGSSCGFSCSSGNFIYKTGDYSYGCLPDTTKANGYCSQTTIDNNGEVTKYSNPEKNKMCGKLTISADTRAGFTGRYYIQLDEYAYIGTVEDGGYVLNPILCQSGFALYFTYDGKYSDSFGNQRYLRCVTPISVNKVNTGGSCSFNYKIGDGDILNYNVKQLSGSEYDDMNDLCHDDYIIIRSERFREYSKNIKDDERETCGDLDNTNTHTCENNELIKSWYFYKHPEKYLIYNNREKLGKVLDYLIQQEYHSYSFSRFLNIKILSLIFLLLF